jgi:sarcosine oxidase delta subunit
MIGYSINDNFICDNCVYKPYCGLCPVSNYSLTGEPVTNVSTSDRCKIFKGIFDYLFLRMREPDVKKIFERWAKNG